MIRQKILERDVWRALFPRTHGLSRGNMNSLERPHYCLDSGVRVLLCSIEMESDGMKACDDWKSNDRALAARNKDCPDAKNFCV